ncbi:MAG: mechanosensitive ion channel [Bacteroidetes bacterium]|nr:mechanosensitive ion channel [Bacteroidota bacterium]MDA0888958.1 mechanosensitive ion channel [Bacteroidota bacterium]MDA1084751.1 mechanosensitive ion channel [Bacteroidota bacterium]
MEKIKSIFQYNIGIGDVQLSLGSLLIWVFVIVSISFLLRITRKILSRKLSPDRKDKFKPVFSFFNYSVYTVVFLLALQNAGVNLTALLAASAALLVGVGFALQTFFQDIISGIFILIDQTVHVGDIIELNDKVGRVEKITLRTTRAVTRDNKVLIIPNHKYLTTTLFNWTENNKVTGESIDIGVAYGTDVDKFKEVVLETAKSHPDVLRVKEPVLLFQNFGDSSLDFTLIVFTEDAFKGAIIKSDLRFAIEKTLRLNNIEIPFPQRVIHNVN